MKIKPKEETAMVKSKEKRIRQKRCQPDIVLTEYGKTAIKRARGSTIRLNAG